MTAVEWSPLGWATLDAEAVKVAEASGGKLETAVRLGDLKAGGVAVDAVGPAPESGGATLTVSKPFAEAADAGNVVAELNGADGPVRRVQVTRETSRFHSEWTFSGVADLKDLKTGIGGDADQLVRLSCGAHRRGPGSTNGSWLEARDVLSVAGDRGAALMRSATHLPGEAGHRLS